MQGRRRPQPSGTNRATAPARKGRAPRARRARAAIVSLRHAALRARRRSRRPRRSAALAAGAHPAPCRTRKLSPPRADGTAGAALWESRSPPIDEADGSRRACWPRRAAALAAGEHPAPCRTRKLSPPGADGTAGAAPWESRSPPPDAGSMREWPVGERPRATLFCLRHVKPFDASNARLLRERPHHSKTCHREGERRCLLQQTLPFISDLCALAVHHGDARSYTGQPPP